MGALNLKNLAYILPDHTSKTYTKDIKLNPGEVVLLTGPSGCGKTYFLDIVEGITKPDNGKVVCKGNIARIHQDLRLIRERTALQNVLDGMIGKRGFLDSLNPSEEDRVLAISWLNKFGLESKADQPVYLLSAGEAQRVAIARAMISSPDVLIADEPFSALDDVNFKRVMSAIEYESASRNMVAIIVTHKLPEYDLDDNISIMSLINESKENKDIKIEEAEIPNNNNLVLHKRLSLFSLFFIGIASLLWLYSDLSSGRFSISILGEFLYHWIPSNEEWKEMPWNAIIRGLLDTLAMASIGTIIAVLLSLPAAMLATKGFSPWYISQPVRYLLNWWRAIPSIIWALICVAAVGLGSFSGIAALVLYSVGYLTKFFYEAFENVDRKPAKLLKSMGASRLQVVYFALMPIALRSILSSSLFMFEYNVRAASILGIVGAGGIGILLKESVEWSNWHVVAVILFLMGFMVIAIDSFSRWIRYNLTPERRFPSN